MPPLRARKEDIPLLVSAFLEEACEENGKGKMEISTEAMAAILDYDWPGNVRELRTAVEHAVVMCSSLKIGTRDLPPSVRESAVAVPTSGESGKDLNLQETERTLILRALEKTGENRVNAAKQLGISRRTLHRRLKELKISKRKPS
jgi:DNA-binding NtrC family response regulator